MFSILHDDGGRTVRLHRFIVKFGTDDKKVEIAFSDAESKDKFVERLGKTPHTVEAIEQSNNEWIDGLEFAGWDEANKALEMGEKAWLSSKPRTFEEVDKQVQEHHEIIDTLLLDNLRNRRIIGGL